MALGSNLVATKMTMLSNQVTSMGNIMDEFDYVYICDECDTLATVIQQGNTITINKCLCTTKEN